MSEFLELDLQKIYDCIKNNPGVYRIKIAELLNIPLTIVERYLSHLEKNNLITSVDEQGVLRYYVKQKHLGFRAKKMLEIREKIYHLILQNPGLHLSKIAEMLQMRISLAEYHLLQLEQSNRIIFIKDGDYYKRYFIQNNGLADHEKKILGLLRQEIPLAIVLYLVKNPSARHGELLDNLHLTTSTLTYHLKKLVECDIVQEPAFGAKGYKIKDRGLIIRYLKKYKIYTLVECFKETWADDVQKHNESKMHPSNQSL